MVYAVTKPCECPQSKTCVIHLNVKPAFVNQLRRATGCSELPSNSVVRQKLHLQNYYLTSKRSRRAPQAASARYDEQRRAQQAALAKEKPFISHAQLRLHLIQPLASLRLPISQPTAACNSCVFAKPCTGHNELPNKNDGTRICAATNARRLISSQSSLLTHGLRRRHERVAGGRCMQNSGLQSLLSQKRTSRLPHATQASSASW